MNLATLNAVARIQQEMEQAGRVSESQALRAVLKSFTGQSSILVTTGEAARRLSLSIPTVKRWIERGALEGGEFGGRWLVSVPSINQIVNMRAALAALAEDGNPTPEEIAEMYGHEPQKHAGVSAA